MHLSSNRLGGGWVAFFSLDLTKIEEGAAEGDGEEAKEEDGGRGGESIEK